MAVGGVQKFERWVGTLSKFLMYLCSFLLAVMLFLSTSDVIGRYLLNRPIVGALETLEILLPAIVLLSLAYTQQEKAHVTVDILVSHLPKRPRAIFGIVTTGWAIVLFAIIFLQGISQVSLYHQTQMVITNIAVPVFLPRILVPIGAVCVCLVLIVDLLQWIRELRK